MVCVLSEGLDQPPGAGKCAVALALLFQFLIANVVNLPKFKQIFETNPAEIPPSSKLYIINGFRKHPNIEIQIYICGFKRRVSAILIALSCSARSLRQLIYCACFVLVMEVARE